MQPYRLHYAPDNASLVIRLALEELGVPYDTVLVDRSAGAQRSAGYRALNPVGRIPALETPHGTMFETAAILLWLADHHGGLAPALDAPERAKALSWLFFLSNTVHAELRVLFYPQTVAGPEQTHQTALSQHVQQNLTSHFNLLEAEVSRGDVLGSDTANICDLYLAVLLRWPTLYPMAGDRGWFDLSAWPALKKLAERIETRASVRQAIRAEGLGSTPFSAPSYPNPPEGSAI